MTKEEFWAELDQYWIKGDMERFGQLWHAYPEFVNERLDEIDQQLDDPTSELHKQHQEWWADLRPRLVDYMGEEWVKANFRE